MLAPSDPSNPLTLVTAPAAPSASAAALIDLLPIPAAIVARGPDGDYAVAVNAAFRVAELTSTRQDAPPSTALPAALLVEVGRFLDGDTARHRLPWRFGEIVDSRHFHLCFSRLSGLEASRCLLTFLDRTSEVRTEHSLRREMTTDSLTGLSNRAGFTDLLEATMATDLAYAVLVVDLARFSRINECLGSLAGDELLISVARRIKGALRAHDVLARTGGDEFGVLLTIEGGPEEAAHVAERIHRILAAPFRLTGYEIRVDCAVGIAFGSVAVDDASELVRHAQFAAKRAKDSGRTERYQARALDQARAAFGIETDLRRAIECGQLHLAFQPIWKLATGRVVAFESLARWTDDAGELRMPGEFIPVAEESGLIVPLGRWAIGETLRTLARWDAASGGDCGVGMAVNLSPIQLGRGGVAEVVAAALAATGIAGTRLKLEITESALIADPDGIAGTLHALKALGATLAMDDFGTGYSNLANLRKLPIDLLKIDRSFVTGMLADRDKVAIVRAILSLAQALGLRTVAEGIETVELGQTLSALGCTYGQGYLYAKPLPADGAYALLRSRNA